MVWRSAIGSSRIVPSVCRPANGAGVGSPDGKDHSRVEEDQEDDGDQEED